jgi:hypothetical protein
MLIIALLFLAGCSTTSTVYLPSGEKYIVRCGRDALVEYQDEKIKLKVDNRGNPGFIDKVITTMMLSSPKIEVGDD